MAESVPDIIWASLSDRYAVLADDSCVPITNLFDEFGEETADAEAAQTFVCGPVATPDGEKWLAADMDAFQRTERQ